MLVICPSHKRETGETTDTVNNKKKKKKRKEKGQKKFIWTRYCRDERAKTPGEEKRERKKKTTVG